MVCLHWWGRGECYKVLVQDGGEGRRLGDESVLKETEKF